MSNRGVRTEPDPECFLAETGGIHLYAYLSNCPLYATVRVIAVKAEPILKRRRSFWLNWNIEKRVWVNNKDVFALPAPLLDWAAERMTETYPTVEAATGCTSDEVQAIRDEQKAKRAGFLAKRKADAIRELTK